MAGWLGPWTVRGGADAGFFLCFRAPRTARSGRGLRRAERRLFLCVNVQVCRTKQMHTGCGWIERGVFEVGAWIAGDLHRALPTETNTGASPQRDVGVFAAGRAAPPSIALRSALNFFSLPSLPPPFTPTFCQLYASAPPSRRPHRAKHTSSADDPPTDAKHQTSFFSPPLTLQHHPKVRLRSFSLSRTQQCSSRLPSSSAARACPAPPPPAVAPSSSRPCARPSRR